MRLAESLMQNFRAFACIGIGAWFLTIAIETSCAQQQISSMASVGDVEVTDTMTVGGGEVIASVEVDNEDIVDVDYVAAQAFLYVGGTGTGSVGAVDYDFSSATSTATTSLTAGQTYNLQGMAGECYYGSGGGGGDDDDDDDDDDDHGVLFVPAVDSPQFSEPPTGENCNEKWLGYLPLTLQTGVPSITSISPNIGTVGDNNKTISVTGENLEDQFGVTNVSISGSGITSSVSGQGSADATVTYSIANNASTGAQSLTMSNSFGTSNAETFTVVDPSPTVTGVAPSTWNAGSSYTVTITGTNFGTNPSVSIALPSGTIQPTTSNPSDTSVTVSFSVPAGSPTGGAPVTVTSKGFNGNGFYNGNTGNSPSATNNSGMVEAQAPPTPTIILGTDATQCGTASSVANSTQSIYIGQQVAFIACIPSLPSGLQVTSSAWSPNMPNSGSALAGFSVTKSVDAQGETQYNENFTQVSSTSCGTGNNCQFSPFYWTAPTTQSFTFTYATSNGLSAQTSIQYSATGPNTTASSTVQSVVSYIGTDGSPKLGLGQNLPNVPYGILITATFDSSFSGSGNYQWVQVISSEKSNVLPEPSDPGNPIILALNSLDTSYPYTGSSTTVGDSPAINLLSKYGEENVTWNANMYLMWAPKAQATCSNAGGNICSIAIPLGFVNWTFCGYAINTLNAAQAGAAQGWVGNCTSTCAQSSCQVGPGPELQQSSGNNAYPIWDNTVRAN